MPSWRCCRSKTVIVGSIQIEMSGVLPSSYSGTHTRYSPGRAVKCAKLFMSLVMLSSPARYTRIDGAQNRLAQLKSNVCRVGILLQIDEIPTRSGYLFRESERESGGNRRVLRWLVAVLREAATTRRLWLLNHTSHLL